MAGTFDVRLIVGNLDGKDTMLKKAYIYVGTVGILENYAGKVIIYPNPANDKIFIKLSSDKKLKVLYIQDISGKTRSVDYHLRTSDQVIPVSIIGFEPGLYFITITTESYTSRLKFIKK
jgi:hypothetical protein